MSILLCAATSFEIQPTLDFIRQKGWSDRVTVLITGIGMLATTYALTKKLAQEKPSLLVQAGIAGSLDPDLALTEVVAVQEETVGDLGVMEPGGFQSLFDMGFQSADEKPWTNGALRNPHHYLLETLALPLRKSVTVNEISTVTDRIDYYRNQLGASTESMEGAAFHYVALQEGVPFLQLRSISNFVGERDKAKWDLKGAVDTLNNHLQEFLIKTLDT